MYTVIIIEVSYYYILFNVCLKTISYFLRFLYGDQARFFDDEIRPELRHSKTGTVAMASAGENCNASQVQSCPGALIDNIGCSIFHHFSVLRCLFWPSIYVLLMFLVLHYLAG
jgi:hypothetical protein